MYSCSEISDLVGCAQRGAVCFPGAAGSAVSTCRFVTGSALVAAAASGAWLEIALVRCRGHPGSASTSRGRSPTWIGSSLRGDSVNTAFNVSDSTRYLPSLTETPRTSRRRMRTTG